MIKSYIVGGWVRDKLLQQESTDKDWVVVGAKQCDLLRKGYQQVGASFPVFLHPETQEEYALARKEKKVGEGYHGFTCEFGPEVTLEEDLKRRDLTINALAFDTETQTIIDPFGGLQDIESKVLREVSEAFNEDPLRLLRLARFHSRFHNFTVAPSLKKRCEQVVDSGELRTLAIERIVQEFKKAHQAGYRPQIFWDYCYSWQIFNDLFSLDFRSQSQFHELLECYQDNLIHQDNSTEILALYCTFFELSFLNHKDNLSSLNFQALTKKLTIQPFLKHFPLKLQKLVSQCVETFYLRHNFSIDNLLYFIQRHRLLHLKEDQFLVFDFFKLQISNEQLIKVLGLLRSCPVEEILSQKGSQSPKEKLHSTYKKLLKESIYVTKFSR